VKEFVTAVEDVVAEDERAARIKARVEALVAEGKTPGEAEKQANEEEGGPFTEFTLDGRVLRAYQPHEGQLTFLMAALGRGQSQESRYASIINLMMEALRPEDQDYFESRLLTRDPKERLPIKKVEEIFEYLVEEWFGRPTQPPSGSAT
jgi:hypothetical protein